MLPVQHTSGLETSLQETPQMSYIDTNWYYQMSSLSVKNKYIQCIVTFFIALFLDDAFVTPQTSQAVMDYYHELLYTASVLDQ